MDTHCQTAVRSRSSERQHLVEAGFFCTRKGGSVNFKLRTKYGQYTISYVCFHDSLRNTHVHDIHFIESFVEEFGSL